MVYSKDFNSANEKRPQQGGRFASASDNIKNKANTARLQGEKTFEVLDDKGNTIRYDVPGFSRNISVSLEEKLSLSDQAKVRADRSVQLRENLRLKANNQAQQVDRTRGQIIKQKARKESRKNTVFIKSKIDAQKSSITELKKQKAALSTPAAIKAEENRRNTMSRGQKRRYVNPLYSIDRSIAAASSTLSSLEKSLSQSQQEEKNIKKQSSIIIPRDDTTVQKLSHVKVHKILPYEKDTRSISEKMKNPATTGPIYYGPLIDTQEKADQINENRKTLREDKDRKKLRTLSDNKIVQAIPFLQKPAKAFDEYFETGKLPHERNIDDSKMFEGGKPNNQLLTGFVSFPSNLIASLDDLGRSTADYIKSGGKEGFVKEDTPFGKAGGYVPKSYNPKIETAFSKFLTGQEVDLNDPLMRGSVYSDVAAIAGTIGLGLKPGETATKTPVQGYTNLKPVEFGKTVYQPKTKIEILKSTFKGKTTLEKTMEQSIKDARVNYNKLTPDQKKSFANYRNTNKIRYTGEYKPKYNFNNKFSSIESFAKFTSEKKNLGYGIGAFIPKGKSVPDVPPKQSGSFNIIGMNKKGGIQSRPFFEEPKAPTKGNQILKYATKQEKQFQKQIEGAYQKNQNTRQSNTLDNLFKKPTKKKYKNDQRTEYSYDYSKILKTNNKPGLKTSVIPGLKVTPILSIKAAIKQDYGIGQVVKPTTAQKHKPKNRQNQAFVPILATNQIPQQTPKLDVPFVPPVPAITHVPRIPPPPRIPPQFPKGGGFLPYVPKISLSSFGFGKKSAVKSGYGAYGISSDINIKTLPTFSRFGKSSKVFGMQMKEDKKIQDLFYGTKKKSKSKSKSKTKRKSSSKKTNTKKKKKK